MRTKNKPVHFGTRLSQLREQAGQTVYRLAKNSGVSPQHVARIESGEQSPSWEIACKLAAALQANLEEFR